MSSNPHVTPDETSSTTSTSPSTSSPTSPATRTPPVSSPSTSSPSRISIGKERVKALPADPSPLDVPRPDKD